MAIPKLCGIENEFGFSVFDAAGKQLENDSYLEAAYRFVAYFLAHEKAIRYDLAKESRRRDIDGDDEEETETLLERTHRLLIESLTTGADGFLANGARFYLDAHHPEYSTPECLTPLELVVHDKASELVMLEAARLFSYQLAGNQHRVFVHKNNSDGNSHSYGCHLNVLLKRELVDSNFKYLVKQYIPFQISRIILIGGGKLGAENNRSVCQFQISQRADFFEKLVSQNTVEKRPIFNTRDEPHADPKKYFRLHDISSDSLMCEQAIFLKVALSQVVLAMIEDGFLKDNVLPKNPVEAMARISRDLSFKDGILLETGKKMTGLEILRCYLMQSKKYLAENPMSDQHILAVGQALELLNQLEQNPLATAGKLDWTTAWKIAESRPEQAKQNLLAFREIYPRGYYWELVKRGKICRLVSDEEIALAKLSPSINTRAYLRSEMIKKFGLAIRDMSWSLFSVKIGGQLKVLEADNPLLAKAEADMLLSNLEI